MAVVVNWQEGGRVDGNGGGAARWVWTGMKMRGGGVVVGVVNGGGGGGGVVNGGGGW